MPPFQSSNYVVEMAKFNCHY